MDVFNAIADPSRRRLLDLLRDEERSVQDLMTHFDVTLGAVSQHLAILLKSGLVARRKAGRFRYYRTNARALREVHEWSEQYRAFWEGRLDRLGDYLEDER